MVAIGVSELGIDFKSLDRAPVYVICLTLGRHDLNAEMLELDESSFRCFGRESFREPLRQAENLDQVLALIDEIDADE